MIKVFIGAELKLEFDVKELVGIDSVVDQEDLKGINQILAFFQTFLKMNIKKWIEDFELVEPVKESDFDEISLFLAVPKYQNGAGVNIKLKGLSKILAEILNKE